MIVLQIWAAIALVAGLYACLPKPGRYAERDWPAEDAAQMEALKEYRERR